MIQPSNVVSRTLWSSLYETSPAAVHSTDYLALGKFTAPDPRIRARRAAQQWVGGKDATVP